MKKNLSQFLIITTYISWKKRQKNQYKAVLKIMMITLRQFSKSLKNTKNIKVFQKKEKNMKSAETFKIPKAEVFDINKLLKRHKH